MDFQNSPLLKAARLCPVDVRTEEAGISVADVLEYLEHDEWETALLLEELGDAHPQLPEFWSLLADAARLMWLQVARGFTATAGGVSSSAPSASPPPAAGKPERGPLVIEKYYEAEDGSARRTVEELSYLERRR